MTHQPYPPQSDPPQPYPPQSYPPQPYPPQPYPPQPYPAQQFAPGGYPPGQFPSPGQVPGPGPSSPGVCGYAIASLVFGILGGMLFSCVFGVMALRRTKSGGERGRGMAIAGLALSGVWVVVWTVVCVLAIVGEATRDSDGAVAQAGTVSSEALAIGDCLSELTESDDVTDVPAVPCGQPHKGEVFAVIPLSGSTWPGEQQLLRTAEDKCDRALYTYSQSGVADPSIEIFFFYPTQDSWTQRDDRSLVCVATPAQGTLTGSIKD
ncbi:MAG: hypothetical protein QG622_2042 [Actinomycetota bacterium]|nr:hypothetical protein [Actinomycetota bacterium]